MTWKNETDFLFIIECAKCNKQLSNGGFDGTLHFRPLKCKCEAANK